MNNSKTNTLIISSSSIDTKSGIIAYDLHKALSISHNSEIITLNSKTKEKNTFSYYSSFEIFVKRVLNKIKKTVLSSKIVKTNRDYYFFEVDLNLSRLNLRKFTRKINKPDVIIAYFTGNFYTITDLYKLQKKYNSPVLLIMADMVHITGGCHYAWECEGYKNQCKNCPAFIDEKHQHLASDNLKINKQLIEKMNISIIAGSSQDVASAKESTLFKNKKSYLISGIINTEMFKKNENITQLKRKYHINESDFLILFGATRIGEKRKGVKYFVDAIKYLEKINPNTNITIVSIGNGDLNDILPDTKFNILNLGFIHDYYQLAEIYNLSDVFVTTTIQDSGPMMINQSIACGTPVVCFDIGVAKDIVINGKTGYQAKLYDHIEIATNINSLVNLPVNDREKMSKQCITLAENNFSINATADVFTSIIKESL